VYCDTKLEAYQYVRADSTPKLSFTLIEIPLFEAIKHNSEFAD